MFFNQVRATYKYTAEDDDELALEVGVIVQVIEYEVTAKHQAIFQRQS